MDSLARENDILRRELADVKNLCERMQSKTYAMVSDC